jgi:hypothetical protein
LVEVRVRVRVRVSLLLATHVLPELRDELGGLLRVRVRVRA